MRVGCMRVYVLARVYVCACAFMRACAPACVRACAPACVRVCAPACVRACAPACVRARAPACVVRECVVRVCMCMYGGGCGVVVYVCERAACLYIIRFIFYIRIDIYIFIYQLINNLIFSAVEN